MQPNYYEGDLIIVNRLAYHFGDPQRGDVIVLYAPGSEARPVLDLFFTQHTTQFIKRVIGLPGDTVEVMDGKTYVNGMALDEPYIKEAPSYYFPTVTIPQGMYFVLGDNRNNSNDSHTGWMVPRNDIIGKVWFRYWKAGYPDIKLIMIPVFGLILGVLIILVIFDTLKGGKTG